MPEQHVIIVDGYNLVMRSPQLRPGPGRTLDEAREKLVNLLSWAIGAGDAHFIVVFDGAGRAGGGGQRGRVEVLFSQPPQKADDVIRRLVEEKVDRVDRLTVVTADLEVARHARAQGANVALSDLFLSSAIGPRSAAEPEKPATLSKKELEEWAEIFRSRRSGGSADEEGSDTEH